MPKHQNAKLLEALKQKPMTALQIWQELGIARASARVFDLREAGYAISSTEITVPNRDGDNCRVALYALETVQRNLIPNHPGRGVMATC